GGWEGGWLGGQARRLAGWEGGSEGRWLGPGPFGGSAMIDEALVELLRPLVEQLVREEGRRAKLGLRFMPGKEGARQLGISEHALRQRVAAGSVPGKRLDGRIYVDMLALDEKLSKLRGV